jgi:hypothetical protein
VKRKPGAPASIHAKPLMQSLVKGKQVCSQNKSKLITGTELKLIGMRILNAAKKILSHEKGSY